MNFAEYRLDVRARQLFRGTTEVHLSPKAFDLLQLLAENPTRAVSKAELHHHLWPATFVSEANLASLVAELRRALGDQSRVPRFIRTVRRFGYAFCAKVTGNTGVTPRGHTCVIVWRGREIPLRDGENILGRDPEATASFDSPSVSRRHARIIVSREGVTVEDLGSKNGTLVRSKRITGPVHLANNDELQIGAVRVIVRLIYGGEATETFEM